MPEPTTSLVINTGPLIALIAGTGDLGLLRDLYERVLVPWEVCQEITAGEDRAFGCAPFEEATWLERRSSPLEIPQLLLNSLDSGEAAVIQLAIVEKIGTVCIDETAGRRVARLSGLSLTGSLGILLRAQREGRPVSVSRAIDRMKRHGIWLSDRVIEAVLKLAKE